MNQLTIVTENPEHMTKIQLRLSSDSLPCIITDVETENTESHVQWINQLPKSTHSCGEYHYCWMVFGNTNNVR